jgi:hypothetical protein
MSVLGDVMTEVILHGTVSPEGGGERPVSKLAVLVVVAFFLDLAERRLAQPVHLRFSRFWFSTVVQ